MTPINPVRIELLSEASSSSLRLTGDPGTTATLSSIGLGTAEVVASGLFGDDGLTEVLAASPPIRGNNLYQFEAAGRRAFQFLPRVGLNISCALNDETGDGVLERLHLSTGPARLHLLMGLPLLPLGDPVKSYAHEIALEESALWGLRSWSDEEGRLLMDEDGDFAMTPVPGADPPRYVETLADLDLNGEATEAVAILRPAGGPGFFVHFYAEMDEPAALLTQSIDLAPAVEPDGYVVTDLNGDVAPDVGIFNAAAGRMVFLINNGLGWFTLAVPGDHDLDGDVDQDDFGGFQTCYTVEDQTTPPAGCGIADHDGDGDVDRDDYDLFEGCASGPAVPADPNCAD